MSDKNNFDDWFESFNSRVKGGRLTVDNIFLHEEGTRRFYMFRAIFVSDAGIEYYIGYSKSSEEIQKDCEKWLTDPANSEFLATRLKNQRKENNMNINKFLEEVNGEKFYPLNFSVVQNGEFLELVLEYDGKPSAVVFSARVGEEDEIMSWLQDKINRTQIMVFNFWAEMHRQRLMPNKKRIFMDSFEFSQWEDEFAKKVKGHFFVHKIHRNVNNVVSMCHEAYVHTEEGNTLCICSTTSHDRLREICEEWLANPANSEFLATV